MNIHPFANLFPMQSDAEIQTLADDIKKHGLRQPIVIDVDEQILDGRNRAAACAIAGVKPIYEPFVGTEAELLAYVASVNIHRRHLSDKQRAEIAAKIATMSVGANQHSGKKKKEGGSNELPSKPVSTKEAAKLLNVSPASVKRAKAKAKPVKPKAIQPKAVEPKTAETKPAKAVKAEPVEYLYSLGERGYEFVFYLYRQRVAVKSGDCVSLNQLCCGDTVEQASFVSRGSEKAFSSISEIEWRECGQDSVEEYETNQNGERRTRELDLRRFEQREGGGQYLYFEPGSVCYYDETAINTILKVQAIAHKREQA